MNTDHNEWILRTVDANIAGAVSRQSRLGVSTPEWEEAQRLIRFLMERRLSILARVGEKNA